MDFVGGRYYELNRILLSSIGLWPYDEPIFKRIKIFLLFSFLITCNIVMISKTFTSDGDRTAILKILSYSIPCSIAILKCITFSLLPASIKKVMKQIQYDWNILNDVKELEIIHKYAYYGWLCTLVFSVLGFGSVFGVFITTCFPILLDVVMPLNISRERKLPIEVEYFVDQKKYFYIIFSHIFIAVCFGVVAVLGTESLYVAYIHHACGLFKIARFQDFLWSKLALSYFILLVMGTASLSINLFCVYEGITKKIANKELLVFCVYVLVHFFYMFCGNYIGQVFIDYSMDVHKNVCGIPWYRIPLYEQKLILFILHQSVHPYKLITGGIIILSLEGFSSLVASSISYFTVLISIQN